jgi:metabolite-proton symporter
VRVVATTVTGERQSIRLVAFASLIGTTIEWYDFFLYGTAAALVFNRLFFPESNPLMGTLYAFGTYAVGFGARPIGGIITGHYGDRVGRKSMLVFTLLVMGIATFLIGLLPTYATLGPWAAVILTLLRVAQGIGVGGEWGGAALMAIEHAPPGRRGFYGSWPQVGVPAGLLVSTAVFSAFSRLPEDQFLAWGWRVPFLVSIVLVGVGLLIRLRLLETPAFSRVKARGEEARRPVLEVLRTQRKEVLLAAGSRVAENGAFYIYSVFMLVYATQHVHVPREVVLNALLVASAIEIFVIPMWGALTDRIGRRPVFIFGGVVTGLTAFPLFWMFDTGSQLMITVAMMIVLLFGHAAMYAPQGAFLPELFGTRVRYSGASLGAQLASVVAGGLSPFIATALLAAYGQTALALYIIFMSLVTIVSVYIAVETMHHDVERV